jgi:purine-binding chemotaxis protein CheW
MHDGMSPEASAQSYVLFHVAGATYAVRSQDVQHMEMIESITPVPNAPSYVDGVVLSRGQVVPVVNLRARFGFERIDAGLNGRLLVVALGPRRVALVADEAREFLRIPDPAIRPPGEAVGGLQGNYLQGIATLGDRVVLVLNVRQLIEASPLVPQADATALAGPGSAPAAGTP